MVLISRDTLHGLKRIMCFDNKQVSNTDMYYQFFIKYTGVEISVKYLFKFLFCLITSEVKQFPVSC